MIKVKWFFPLLPILFLIGLLFFILKPAITLPLPGVTYVDLEVVVADFGKNLSLFYPPLKYFVYHYGTQFTSILLVYKLFGFSPMPWFTIDIFLRIAAAVVIYLFVTKWSKSKLAGVVAGIFFGVNLPGLQPTTRVAFFLVYGAVIALFIFLDRWLRFHYRPTLKTLTWSALFFALAILTYPIRMIGTIPLILLGESYWILKNYRDKILLKLQIKHILTLLVIILLFVFVTETLASSPELSFKRISPTILFTTLITGYPPVINTLWLFVSNVIISPASFLNNTNSGILQNIPLILFVISVFFLFSCILRKKFLLAFASLTVITFTSSVAASARNLADWSSNLITITQIGGSLFILANLFLLYMRSKNKQLTEIGILGSMIVLTAILFPWLISPVKSSNDQSAFNFIHRYYTIPSAGMGLLFGAVVVLSLEWLKDNLSILLKLKNKMDLFRLIKGLIFIPIPIFIIALITYSIYWNLISTNKLLISIGNGADASKIELFWNKINPLLVKIKEPPALNYIYVDNKSSIDNKYITEMMQDRIIITRKMVFKPPKVTVIFSKNELSEILSKKGPDDILYLLEFDGKEVKDISKK